MEHSGSLRIYGKASPIHVLGPGNRAVIWVQGCARRCTDCSAPESWDVNGGYEQAIDDLTKWVLQQCDIDGLTISGGEPMLQADAVCQLVDAIREVSDIGVVCYTGYELGELLYAGTQSQHALLQRVDMLIDGPYVPEQHASLRWRGSRNQRIVSLSDRYADIIAALYESNDVSAGLQFFVEENGVMGYAGIPATPGFHQEFRHRLSKRGVTLRSEMEGS